MSALMMVNQWRLKMYVFFVMGSKGRSTWIVDDEHTGVNLGFRDKQKAENWARYMIAHYPDNAYYTESIWIDPE
jgi:hypothetical protein